MIKKIALLVCRIGHASLTGLMCYASGTGWGAMLMRPNEVPLYLFLFILGMTLWSLAMLIQAVNWNKTVQLWLQRRDKNDKK